MAPATSAVLMELDGLRFYLLRRTNQKHINIRISHTGEIRVSAPASASMPRILVALKSRRTWIHRNLQRIQSGLVRVQPLDSVRLHGKQIALRVTPSLRKRSRITLNVHKDLIEAEIPEGSELEPALKKWFIAQAHAHFDRLGASLSRSTGIRYQKVFVRDQRTRWGSSSSKGNLSINWRAILLPDEIQHYLMVHELVHQEHMNHSRTFWRRVAQFCPDYRDLDRHLKDHAYLLAFLR